jgi:hypothetical protein
MEAMDATQERTGSNKDAINAGAHGLGYTRK